MLHFRLTASLSSFHGSQFFSLSSTLSFICPKSFPVTSQPCPLEFCASQLWQCLVVPNCAPLLLCCSSHLKYCFCFHSHISKMVDCYCFYYIDKSMHEKWVGLSMKIENTSIQCKQQSTLFNMFTIFKHLLVLLIHNVLGTCL